MRTIWWRLLVLLAALAVAMRTLLHLPVFWSYRPQPFQNDRQRVEYLFALYEKLIAPLIAPTKKERQRK